MLEPLVPGKVNIRPNQYVPPFLTSLIAAAKEGNDLLPFVESITRHLGFESFMYAASAMTSRTTSRRHTSTRRCRSPGSRATTRWRMWKRTRASP